MAILDNSGKRREEGRGLVKMSANWCWLQTSKSLMKPSLILSHVKWQSIIYFVRSWKIGFVAIWIAAWLSQKINAGEEDVIWKSRRSWCIQTSSLVVDAKALYSASADDLEIMVCFLALQEISESPRSTQNPVINFLEFSWIRTWSPISVSACLKLEWRSSSK